MGGLTGGVMEMDVFQTLTKDSFMALENCQAQVVIHRLDTMLDTLDAIEASLDSLLKTQNPSCGEACGQVLSPSLSGQKC